MKLGSDQSIRTFSKEKIQHQLTKDRASSANFSEKNLIDALIKDGYFTKDQIDQLDQNETIFRNYTFVDKIGSGRFGLVYKAIQHNMGKRVVAIKLIKPGSMERFQRQVKALGKLQHPNIITAIESGQISGINYMVLEYFHGTQLDQYIKGNGSLSEESTLKIAQSLASALQHIWSKNLVHRDISPRNIMIGKHEVKLCDFHLIRAIETDKEHTHGIPIRAYDYTAPELMQKGKISFTSDCFSLGAILYFCLTGRSPFEKLERDAEKSEEETGRTPNSLRRFAPNVSRSLEKFIYRLLLDDPELRCTQPQNFLNEIEYLIRENKKHSLSKLILPTCLIVLISVYLGIPQVRTFVKQEIVPFIKGENLGERIYRKRVNSVVIVKVDKLLGSGIITQYNQKKLIVTNAHVVHNRENVKVILKDGRFFDLKVLDIYNDENVDIAFIECPESIDNTYIMPISQKVSIGQNVFAIGHPKGYQWSITSGTVSAIRGNTVQTDTPINQGNSGGPLLNKNGEMIGINTFVIKQANDVNFAISTSKILECLQKSTQNGKL